MKKILVAASMMLFGTIGLQAALTPANTEIKNTASLSYAVSGVTQTNIDSNEDSFVVDKKIDFVLTQDNGQQVTVVPDQSNAETTWTLKNEGNMDQNFTLAAAQLTGGESIYGHPDTQNTDALSVEVDLHDGSGWQAYAAAIEIAPEANASIRIRTHIPDTRVEGDVMNISLTTVAVKSDGTTAETNTGDAAPNADQDRQHIMDTVLAEGDHASDRPNEANTNYDGTTVRWGGYILHAPKLDLTKMSCVWKDGITADNTKAKRIPGATLVYVFDINNTSTATDATDVNLTDALPAHLILTGTVASTKLVQNVPECKCDNGYEDGNNVNAVAKGDTSLGGVGGNVLKIEKITIEKSSHTCISVNVEIE